MFNYGFTLIQEVIFRMNPLADSVEWIIGNDDSLVSCEETDVQKIANFADADIGITEDLGLLISSKTFFSRDSIFFEEYEA
jgi:hypothetical protein